MNFWPRAPLLRIAAYLASGIILHEYINYKILLALSLGLWGIFALINKRFPLIAPSIRLAFISICAGSIIAEIHLSEELQCQIIKEESVGIVVCDNIPVYRNNWQMRVKFLCSQNDSLNGYYLFQIDSLNLALKAGDVLVGEFKILPHAVQRQLSGFDYNKWLIAQGIRGRITNITPLQQVGNKTDFKHFFANWRETLNKNLPLEGDQHGLLSALCLGWKQEMSAESKSFFKDSGTMHILAVSGMHVGLVLLLLQKMTIKLKRRKIIRFVIIVSSIWIFSLLSGASVSTLRAALMLSFVQGAELSGRKGAAINLLGGSAISLFAFDPATIYDLGFLLSFFAVLGILLYQELNPLQSRFQWLNAAGGGLWVSISAQAWTSPITLYNFHFFPTWFLLANFIALPLSTILLYGALLWFVIGWIPYLNDVLEFSLYWLSKALLWVLEWISSLPKANAGPYFPEFSLTIASFIVLLGIHQCLLQKRLATLIIHLCYAALVIAAFHLMKTPDQPEILLSQKFKNPIEITFENKQVVFSTNDSLTSTKKLIISQHFSKDSIHNITPQFKFENNETQWIRTSELLLRNEYIQKEYLSFSERDAHIFILRKPNDFKKMSFKLPSCELIIFDDSWTQKEFSRLGQQADSMNISAYSTKDGWISIYRIKSLDDLSLRYEWQ